MPKVCGCLASRRLAGETAGGLCRGPDLGKAPDQPFESLDQSDFGHSVCFSNLGGKPPRNEKRWRSVMLGCRFFEPNLSVYTATISNCDVFTL